MIGFFVEGIPVQQGSKVPGKRNDGSLFVRESAKGHKYWRQHVRLKAIEAVGTDFVPFDEPVNVGLDFVFPRLKTDPTRLWKWTAPDLDKLIRAILDALTGVVYKDDARVVKVYASKVHGGTPGVSIIIQTKEG